MKLWKHLQPYNFFFRPSLVCRSVLSCARLFKPPTLGCPLYLQWVLVTTQPEVENESVADLAPRRFSLAAFIPQALRAYGCVPQHILLNT